MIGLRDRFRERGERSRSAEPGYFSQRSVALSSMKNSEITGRCLTKIIGRRALAECPADRRLISSGMVIDWGRSSAASCLEKRRIRLTGCWQRLESANVSRFRRSCSESAFTFGGSIADPTYLRHVVELDRTVQTWRKPSCTDQQLFRLFRKSRTALEVAAFATRPIVGTVAAIFHSLRSGYVSW
jgi:hypothetical protein